VRIVELLVVRQAADIVEAHLAFQLNAGVDLVLAAHPEPADETSEVLDAYSRHGYVRRVSGLEGTGDDSWRAGMARLAVDEHGADWILDAEVDEFWMPRAETLQEILLAIPERYGIVQALVRVFLPVREEGRYGLFAQRMTARRAPYAEPDEAMRRIDWALRPVYRARSVSAVGLQREAALDGRVPLRAWYPIEVLRYPLRSLGQAERWAAGLIGPPQPRSRIEHEVLEAHRAGRLAATWERLVVREEAGANGASEQLVRDERVVEVLRRLEQSSPLGETTLRFAPDRERSHVGLRTPTIVDDVAFAGECADVGEVDFDRLIDRIAELEGRIGALEAGSLGRVRRALARLRR
jgi:hypothetical protein